MPSAKRARDRKSRNVEWSLVAGLGTTIRPPAATLSPPQVHECSHAIPQRSLSRTHVFGSVCRWGARLQTWRARRGQLPDSSFTTAACVTGPGTPVGGEACERLERLDR